MDQEVQGIMARGDGAFGSADIRGSYMAAEVNRALRDHAVYSIYEILMASAPAEAPRQHGHAYL